MKKTPFYEKMLSHGGKMVDFTGYLLPIQFEGGIIFEHKSVRENAGLFDVSHMGEFLLKGKNAFDTIQNIITNDITSLKEGAARYSLMTNERGGIVDDILIYKFNDETYMLVVNAANCEKDAAWVSSHLKGDTLFENVSEKTAQLALQGRNAINIIKEFIDEKSIPEKNYTFNVVDFMDEKIILSRTGYTGEDGFELYSSVNIAEKLFDTVIEKGKLYGMALCGLGARDTLRMEAAMPLYGHEMNEDTLATEIGLDYFIKMNKDFIGKSALEKNSPKYKRAGIKLIDRGIAREGSLVFDGNGKEIGHVTSGTHSPTLGYPIGMLRIEKDFNGNEIFVDVRGKKLLAEIVSLPFYKRK